MKEKRPVTRTPVQEQERREHRRKYKSAWERSHYHTLSTRVPLETAEAFKRVCKREGITTYTLLKGLIWDVVDTYGKG